MSSFYDDASLVVIPSGYKTSKVYAEKPTDGSGDLAFTRTGDTATRVNSAGLIEKVRTNLALYSEQFDNAFWIKTNTTVVANSGIAPNGTTTAELIYPTTTGSNRLLEKSLSISAATPYTGTWYLKASGLNWVAIDHIDGNVGAWFNLSTGTIGTISSGTTASIESVGNGWYRCRISKTSGGSTGYHDIRLVDGDNVISVTANGTNGVLVWGAQLETGDVATAYIPTTTAAVSVGMVANTPRLDFLGSTCPRLLLEPQRTNVALNSETFAASTGTTIVLNNTASPDGYVSADKLVEDTTTGVHITGFGGSLGGSVDSSVYSVSVFAKAAGRTRFQFFDNNQASGGLSVFDIANGVVISGSGKIENYGNGWYRCIIFPVKDNSTTSNCQIRLISTGTTTSYTGNGTSGIFLWGAQVEAGAYATSYIPTLGASATRGKDFYAKAGFGNTSTAGTLYYEFQNHQSPASASGYYMVCLFAGSTVTSTDFSPEESISIINNGLSVQGRNDGYSTTLFSITPAINATVKVALRYDGTNVVAFVNGVKGTVFSDTAVGVKNAIQVNNGQNATHATKQLLYFPSALTDAQLIELTTL